MGRSVLFQFDKGYYAARANDSAPWLIRNAEHRVVGHYSVANGVQWGDYMEAADKEWLGEMVKMKLG